MKTKQTMTPVKKIIFSIIAILLSLLILEMSFRIIYAIRYKSFTYITFGITNVFGFHAYFLDGYIKLGEAKNVYHGFRTEPFELKKPADEFRIVALGGSSTYNLTSGGLKESWPYLLQQKLNSTYKDYRYKVINAGVPQQTTYGVDRLLTKEIFSYNPDAVIIYELYNHVFIDAPALYGKGETINYFYRIFQWLFHNKSLLGTYIIEKFGSRTRSEFTNNFDTYRYLLSDMIQKCHQHKVKIFVVKQLINPKYFLKSKLDARIRNGNEVSPTQYFDYMKIIDETCKKKDCFLVDFSASSPLCKDSMNRILTDAVHLTVYGNDLLADTLYKKFVELKSLKKL